MRSNARTTTRTSPASLHTSGASACSRNARRSCSRMRRAGTNGGIPAGAVTWLVTACLTASARTPTEVRTSAVEMVECSASGHDAATSVAAAVRARHVDDRTFRDGTVASRPRAPVVGVLSTVTTLPRTGRLGRPSAWLRAGSVTPLPIQPARLAESRAFP
jgi:hypothetical protein